MSRRIWVAAGIVLVIVAAGTVASGAAPKPKTIRISLKANGKEVPLANAEYVAVSAKGRFIAFESTGKLSPKDNDDEHDVYVYDRRKAKSRLVSVRSNGKPGNADCAAADISPNARFVSFACDGKLSGKDQNAIADIYRHDRRTGKTILISVRSDGSQVNGVDDGNIVSGVANNGIVAWESHGAFTANDLNDAWDVFVRNPRAGTTKRASLHDDDSELPNGADPLGPTKATKVPISANGNIVAFTSADPATDQFDYGFAADRDVFVRNMSQRTTQWVSLKGNGDEADPNDNANTFTPSMSADGRYVAFRADPFAKFVDADDNIGYDIYVKDRKTGRIRLASFDKVGEAVASADAQFPEISANGRYVVWDGFADWSGDGGDPTGRDVYRRDLDEKRTQLVSATFKGLRGDDNQIPDASSSGWVGFQSMDKLTPQADDGFDWDVFLRGPIH